ncbi:MAG TPA: hypothetical protein VFG04_09790 [Planctomycetaceae bacterium]|nr:hypothetical protein [Planctomycetaceae bacterium]
MPVHHGSAGQNGNHSQLEMHLSSSDVLAIVSRNRWKLAAFGCAMVAGALVLSSVWPKTYRSEAKLYVRLGRENLGLDATSSLGHEINGIQINREDELNTVVDLLKSHSLLEKVVDAVGPETILNPTGKPASTEASGSSLFGWAHNLTSDSPLPARERAVLALRKQLDTQNVRKTNVILVAHEGPSAEASQKIVSNLINLYLDEHVRMSRSPHEHAFLAEQASSIKKQLVQRETDLRTFKDQTGLASPAEQRLTLVGQLGRLEDDIKSTLAAIEGTEAEHHAVVAEQGRVSAVDTRAKEELRMMLLREKPVLASQRAKLARLQTQLADAKEQMKALNGNENRITQMQREAQILEVSYRKYSEGLEQARLDESLESQRISNINVAQPATLSFQSVKPQRSLFLVAGLLLAFFGGPTLAVLFSVYRPLSTAPHSVDHRLDMPALAPAPAMRDAQPVGA